jgi:Sigma-70, region 4
VAKERQRYTPADHDAPSFEDQTGWITLAEAAERLGISKQAVHKRQFESLRSLRQRAEYLVQAREIDAEKERMAAGRASR